MRVRKRLALLGISAQAASLRAGFSRDTVGKMLKLGAGLPRGGNLSKLAQALETTEHYLLNGEDLPATSDGEPRDLTYETDEVEIKATVAGSHHEGAFQLFDNAIGHTGRPIGLKRYQGVYAIVIVNDSMSPEHKPGQVRFVTPSVKPVIGDSVVIEYERDPERGPEAMIGHLRRNGTTIKIGKLNPPAELEFDSRQVKLLHRIAPEAEVR